MIGFQMDTQRDELEEIVTDYFLRANAWLQIELDKALARKAEAKRLRRLEHLNKRRGWRIATMGGMLSDCQGEAQEAGWQAYRVQDCQGQQTSNENWALLVADALKLEVQA